MDGIAAHDPPSASTRPGRGGTVIVWQVNSFLLSRRRIHTWRDKSLPVSLLDAIVCSYHVSINLLTDLP